MFIFTSKVIDNCLVLSNPRQFSPMESLNPMEMVHEFSTLEEAQEAWGQLYGMRLVKSNPLDKEYV